MRDNLEELKYVLQTLGLPVTGQLRLVADDCSRIGLLTGAFAAAQHAVRVQEDDSLTPSQASALTDLGARLVEVQQQTRSPLCSELALRESADWQQVRTMARRALVRFSWTLEVPPDEVLQSPDFLN